MLVASLGEKYGSGSNGLEYKLYGNRWKKQENLEPHLY